MSNIYNFYIALELGLSLNIESLIRMALVDSVFFRLVKDPLFWRRYSEEKLNYIEMDVRKVVRLVRSKILIKDLMLQKCPECDDDLVYFNGVCFYMDDQDLYHTIYNPVDGNFAVDVFYCRFCNNFRILHKKCINADKKVGYEKSRVGYWCRFLGWETYQENDRRGGRPNILSEDMKYSLTRNELNKYPQDHQFKMMDYVGDKDWLWAPNDDEYPLLSGYTCKEKHYWQCQKCEEYLALQEVL